MEFNTAYIKYAAELETEYKLKEEFTQFSGKTTKRNNKNNCLTVFAM